MLAWRSDLPALLPLLRRPRRKNIAGRLAAVSLYRCGRLTAKQHHAFSSVCCNSTSRLPCGCGSACRAAAPRCLWPKSASICLPCIWQNTCAPVAAARRHRSNRAAARYFQQRVSTTANNRSGISTYPIRNGIACLGFGTVPVARPGLANVGAINISDGAGDSAAKARLAPCFATSADARPLAAPLLWLLRACRWTRQKSSLAGSGDAYQTQRRAC